MSKHTIPATVETICDRCGCKICLANDNHHKEGRLILNYNTVMEPMEFDLCDSCTQTVKDALQQVMSSGVFPNHLANNFMKGSLR